MSVGTEGRVALKNEVRFCAEPSFYDISKYKKGPSFYDLSKYKKGPFHTDWRLLLSSGDIINLYVCNVMPRIQIGS